MYAIYHTDPPKKRHCLLNNLGAPAASPRPLHRASDKVGVSSCRVAQICNLLYRRFLIGKAPKLSGGLQVANLRYDFVTGPGPLHIWSEFVLSRFEARGDYVEKPKGKKLWA